MSNNSQNFRPPKWSGPKLSSPKLSNQRPDTGPVQAFPMKRRNPRPGPRPGWKNKEDKLTKRIQILAKRLRKDWDLNEYKDFFIAAREMKRTHLFFAGPTNSGKSYRGFNELAQCQSGSYLAPLRLLALEGQEELEKRSKPCSLLTGEEMDLREGASFIASTIEMADLDTPIECALVDEVQLLLDPNRGWAWTQALVGLPAQKIIMTGSPECIPALKKLIEDYLGETLEVIYLDRIGKLEMLPKPLHEVKRATPATAVIAFSRRTVLSIKKELEDAGRKVSVIYGNLSPGVRREEARRFRSGETDILVATDCIGMGLNLPIQTIIFAETDKFDGKGVRMLEPQEVKQIAGRAGRFGKFEMGYVGATRHGGMKLVQNHLHFEYKDSSTTCFVRPTESQLEVLRDQIGNSSIKNALLLFSKLGNSESVLKCSDLAEMMAVAERIENLEALSRLSFAEKYLFTCAPVSSNDKAMEIYIRWLIHYAKENAIDLEENDYRLYMSQPNTSDDSILNEAEINVKILTLYHWLARKKPSSFPSWELCEFLRERINAFIENSLKKKGLHKKCTQCGKQLSIHHHFRICDACHKAGW